MPLTADTELALAEREARLDRLIARFLMEAGATRSVLASLEDERRDAWLAVGTAVLVSPDADTNDALARQLAMPELAVATQRRDLDVARRFWTDVFARHRDPQESLAIVTHRLEELSSHADALRQSVNRVARDNDFHELISGGYDPQDGAWFTYSFHRDRRRADKVVHRLGPHLGAMDFEGVVARHQDERSALQILDVDIQALHATRRALLEGVAARREAESQLRDLDQRHIDELRRRVVEVIRATRPNQRRTMLAEHPGADALIRADALDAKSRYLSCALAHHVERGGRHLGNRKRDLDDVRAGLVLAASPEDTRMETMQIEREAANTLAEFGETVRRIVGFQDFARAKDAPDILWWDLFTDGAVNGDYVDEVVWARTRRVPSSHVTEERAATWVSNAANAASRLAQIWDSIKDADDKNDDDDDDAPTPTRAAPPPADWLSVDDDGVAD